MTEEEQQQLEDSIKEVANQFGLNAQVWRYSDKFKQRKKIVIEYAEQNR